jgi:CubicO group peptidase (beta-lactamase class C family)
MTAIVLFAALLVPQARYEEAFRKVREAVERGDVPGAIALVADRDAILRHEAFGLCDLENRVPFTPTTLCWIASLTKPVTVAAAMTLVDRGKIALDDPVRKYLPEFMEHPAFTIRQLMAHSSGILAGAPPGQPPAPELGVGKALSDEWLRKRLPDIVKAIAARPLEFAPGTRTSYSNSGMFVLGRVIETVSGKAYAEVVRENILVPLGMRDTAFVPSQPVSCIYQGTKLAFRYRPSLEIVNTSPSGGLFSHPGDYLKFLRLFLNDGGRILSREAAQEMLKLQSPARGLGWGLVDGTFVHGGSSGTHAWGNPRSGILGILFVQYADDQGKVVALQKAFQKAVTAAGTVPGE